MPEMPAAENPKKSPEKAKRLPGRVFAVKPEQEYLSVAEANDFMSAMNAQLAERKAEAERDFKELSALPAGKRKALYEEKMRPIREEEDRMQLLREEVREAKRTQGHGAKLKNPYFDPRMADLEKTKPQSEKQPNRPSPAASEFQDREYISTQEASLFIAARYKQITEAEKKAYDEYQKGGEGARATYEEKMSLINGEEKRLRVFSKAIDEVLLSKNPGAEPTVLNPYFDRESARASEELAELQIDTSDFDEPEIEVDTSDFVNEPTRKDRELADLKAKRADIEKQLGNIRARMEHASWKAANAKQGWELLLREHKGPSGKGLTEQQQRTAYAKAEQDIENGLRKQLRDAATADQFHYLLKELETVDREITINQHGEPPEEPWYSKKRPRPPKKAA